jgi:nucleoside-diphosphate-sugar epimerase
VHVVITGASGFIGQVVARKLAADQHQLTLLGGDRVPTAPAGGAHRCIAAGAIETCPDLADHLAGADAVVHLAGRAHIINASGAESDAAFHAANADAVRQLCDVMRQRDIKRLIFVSSIAARQPINAYGRSKLAGEAHALDFAKHDGSFAAILRPPLVYGPNAPGNLSRLISIMRRGLPMPFASVRNRRSLCAVDNVADAIARIIQSPGHSGTYEVCDDAVVSLPEIVAALGKGMERPATQFPFPQALLFRAARLASESTAQGFGDMTLSNAALRRDFGWQPPIDTVEGLAQVGRASRDGRA